MPAVAVAYNGSAESTSPPLIERTLGASRTRLPPGVCVDWEWGRLQRSTLVATHGTCTCYWYSAAAARTRPSPPGALKRPCQARLCCSGIRLNMSLLAL